MSIDYMYQSIQLVIIIRPLIIPFIHLFAFWFDMAGAAVNKCVILLPSNGIRHLNLVDCNKIKTK